MTPPPVDQQAANQVDLSKSLILVVDDNAQNIELIQAYLEPLGCQTEVAVDGVAALERVEDRSRPRPDLVILDIMMPRMSGFEVCKRIKANPITKQIPVMMVTALNEVGDIERGVESGTDDFLTKPVNKLELLTRVRSLLSVGHLKQELDRTYALIREMQTRTPGEGV